MVDEERTELYRVEMSEFQDIPAADDLIADASGAYFVGNAEISGAGNYTRGELMMSGSDGKFIPATKAGISTAKEIAILCEDFSLEDGQYTKIACYFSGLFFGERVILPYETVESVHSEELVEIEPVLRQHKIFLA